MYVPVVEMTADSLTYMETKKMATGQRMEWVVCSFLSLIEFHGRTLVPQEVSATWLTSL